MRSHRSLYLLSLWQPISNLADRQTCTKRMILFRLIPLNALHRPTFLADHGEQVSSIQTAERRCELDYLTEYMTTLVENVKCSVCKSQTGGLFPSSEFSHEALETQLFTLYPVTQYIHTLCHETLKCPPIPGCGIWTLMLTDIPDRTETCLLGWARLLSTSATDLRRPYLVPQQVQRANGRHVDRYAS